MTEAPNGFCTCYPDGTRAGDCGVVAHRQEAYDNEARDRLNDAPAKDAR